MRRTYTTTTRNLAPNAVVIRFENGSTQICQVGERNRTDDEMRALINALVGSARRNSGPVHCARWARVAGRTVHELV